MGFLGEGHGREAQGEGLGGRRETPRVAWLAVLGFLEWAACGGGVDRGDDGGGGEGETDRL